jgi:hypothetical protein
LNDALQASFSPGGFFYYAWVIPGITICVILAIYFIKFFLRLPRRYQTLFFLSARLFVGGAAGMEMVDGYILDYDNILYPLHPGKALFV